MRILMAGGIEVRPVRRYFVIVIIALIGSGHLWPAGPALAEGISDAERAAISRVNIEAIQRTTTDLSAPSMEGRGTAQPGGDRAAQYIANHYAELGLKPLGIDGKYFQPVRFRAAQVLQASALTSGDVGLSLRKDFVFAPPLPQQPVDVTGGLIFAAFGAVSKELNRDDLASVEPRGKVVMIVRGRPKNVDEAAWRRNTTVPDVVSVLGSRGALAVLVVAEQSGDSSYESLADRYGRRRVSLADETPAAGPLVLYVNPVAAARIFDGTGETLAELRASAEAGQPVSREMGRSVTVSFRVSEGIGTSNNIAGMIEGSDRRLKTEAVVLTAHYDAFGIAQDGRVYPGAADNALGVAEMLAVARAVAGSAHKPRRSFIFVAVTGEEYGMLGSRYWVQHPTWPLAHIAANINFDGVGTETYGPVKQVFGFGAEYSDLAKVLSGVAIAVGAEIIPDPVAEQGIFYRSDQYSFARGGIPAINILGGPGDDTKVWVARIFSWVATSYHQPGDVIRADWDWDGPRTLAVIGLLVALRVANADTAPNWLPSAPFKRESVLLARLVSKII
jgi:Zn-dependent M28 family amino/carboxypeptidase